MTALPAKYFAFPPYRAESLGGNMGWWGRDESQWLERVDVPGQAWRGGDRRTTRKANRR